MGSRHLPMSPWAWFPRLRGGRDRTDYMPHYPQYYIEDLDVDPRLYFEPRGSNGHSNHLKRRHRGHGISDRGRRPVSPADELDDSKNRKRMAGQKRDVPSVEKAMRKLHMEIGKIESEFNSFKSDYESDISNIRNYVTLEVLNKIWVQKVAGKKDKRTCEENEDSHEDVGTKKPKEKFSDLKKKLDQAFDTASTSMTEGIRSQKNKTRSASAKRLLGKIDTAQDQIMDLLERAMKAQDDCKDLLHELEQFKNLIDPENEQNRKLYKSGNDEEDEGNDEDSDEDDEHSSGGRGGWDE